MLRDIKTILTLTKDPEYQNYIKYIDIIYYHIRKFVKDGKLKIKWILNSLILTNDLIKLLSAEAFKKY